MRILSRLPTLLVLLAFVCFFCTTVIADHDESAQRSEWLGNLYGNTEIWGLGYFYPWGRSSHHITVSNETGSNAYYLFEFKASVPEANPILESKHPTQPTDTKIVDGATKVIQGQMNVDLRKAANIETGQLFTLSCYTRIKITNKAGKSKGWRVTLEHIYMK